MNKLFESNKQGTVLTVPDAQIIWHCAPFILYKQFRLKDNFRQYLETSILLKNFFHMGIKKTPLLKCYELPLGAQSYTVEFTSGNRQFD